MDAGPQIEQAAGVALPSLPSNRLAQHREELIRAIEEAGGINPRLFGSVARGDDIPDSDVDIMVDFPRGTGLMTISGLALHLEKLLGCKVDIVSSRALDDPYFGPRIAADLRPL